MQYYNTDKYIWNRYIIFKKEFLNSDQTFKIEKFLLKEKPVEWVNLSKMDNWTLDNFFGRSDSTDFIYSIHTLKTFQYEFIRRKKINMKPYQVTEQFWIDEKYIELLDKLRIYTIHFNERNNYIQGLENDFIIMPIDLINLTKK